MGSRSQAGKRFQQKIDRQLDQRTKTALMERNERFAAEHEQESDEWLLEYIRSEARRLDSTLYRNEVIGGSFISARFGGWDCALIAAGLKPIHTPSEPKIERLHIYKVEYRHQAKLYRKETEIAREKRKAENKKRTTAAQEDLERRTERDLRWGQEHETDSDEALLDYIRRCAEDLGYTPVARDVLGGVYISRRFGNWSVAIYLSGLPFTRRVKKPKGTAIDAYWKSRRGQTSQHPE